MQTKTRILPPEILLEEYRALLREDSSIESLPLVITGGSMSPFLIGGRDTVYLSRPSRPIRRGDAVLYRRKSGGYVFHRVYRVSKEGLTMVGDAQTVLEPGIQPDQIIAIMTAADRNGKHLSPGQFWWDFFEKIWIRILPIRRPVCHIYTLFAHFFINANKR